MPSSSFQHPNRPNRSSILVSSPPPQIVTYRADDDGYHATVEYEGEQHFDPPIYNEPGPTYHPEPSPYHPEPIAYHPEPAVYEHPEPPTYHPEPTGLHLETKSYEPEPPTYRHPEPFSFIPEPPPDLAPVEPIATYQPTPAPLYQPTPAHAHHHPGHHPTLYHPAPAPLHHGPLRRWGCL